MAKKRKKKNYLPKRIAGVRVPKTVRRAPVGEFLTSAAGQAIIAALILRAGSRLAHDADAAHPVHALMSALGISEPAQSRDAGPSPSRADPTADGAPRHSSFNYKHALAEAARHFILGLSHPKGSGRERRQDAAAERPNGDGGARAGERDAPTDRRAEVDRASPH